MTLIDRDKLLEYIDDNFYPTLKRAAIERHNMFIDAINNAPTVDAVPVRRGVWYKYPANGIECSECGLFGYVGDGYEGVYNFCPRCGADMREE